MRVTIHLPKASIAIALLVASGCTRPDKPEDGTATARPAVVVPYGANAPASATFVHDGVTLYYETYGAGEPLLLVHGNGCSIATMAAQIDFFKTRYRVIAMDSRDHGRSGDSDSPITYEQMTDDLAALIEHLQLGAVNVLGWSDGGIEALLLGVRHPAKVKKLVAMAANLEPGHQAVYRETLELWTSLGNVPDSIRATAQGQRAQRVASLMLKEPHIDPRMLARISAPTLVLAGDHDLIRTEHTVDIFNHLPNGQLAILPNSTHMVPFDDPASFNGIVDRFLSAPFKKRDRIADVMTSYEKLMANQPK